MRFFTLIFLLLPFVSHADNAYVTSTVAPLVVERQAITDKGFTEVARVPQAEVRFSVLAGACQLTIGKKVYQCQAVCRYSDCGIGFASRLQIDISRTDFNDLVTTQMKWSHPKYQTDFEGAFNQNKSNEELQFVPDFFELNSLAPSNLSFDISSDLNNGMFYTNSGDVTYKLHTL